MAPYSHRDVGDHHLTVGVAAPLAATLSTIAGLIATATGGLDLINSLVLKQLVQIFRELHTFTSDADPRDVVTQGAAIEKASDASSSALAGFASGKLVEKGAAHVGKRFGPNEPKTPVQDHPDPAPAAVDGPSVKGTTQANAYASGASRGDARSPVCGQGTGGGADSIDSRQ